MTEDEAALSAIENAELRHLAVLYRSGENATPTGWSSTALRFLLPSILVVLLLAGGIVWIRSLPSGMASADPASTVMVRLLQSPEPTPFAAVQSPGTHLQQSVGQRRQLQSEPVDPTTTEMPPVPQTTASITPDQTAIPDVRSDQQSFSEPPNVAVAQFQRALMQHIAKFQRYPASLGGDHAEGTVQIAFVMGRDGRIVDAWIKTSSGHVVLDQEAIDALRRAEPLPTIPSGLPDRLSVLAPISFAPQ
jgi:periplasmic protein TonB